MGVESRRSVRPLESTASSPCSGGGASVSAVVGFKRRKAAASPARRQWPSTSSCETWPLRRAPSSDSMPHSWQKRRLAYRTVPERTSTTYSPRGRLSLIAHGGTGPFESARGLRFLSSAGGDSSLRTVQYSGPPAAEHAALHTSQAHVPSRHRHRQEKRTVPVVRASDSSRASTAATSAGWMKPR